VENEPKTRLDEWDYFSNVVRDHIAGYTINQYNDKGRDIATEYTYEICMENIKRYINRFKTNQRKDQGLLDILKIAHYACIGFFKKSNEDEIKEETNNIVMTKDGMMILKSFIDYINPTLSKNTKNKYPVLEYIDFYNEIKEMLDKY